MSTKFLGEASCRESAYYAGSLEFTLKREGTGNKGAYNLEFFLIKIKFYPAPLLEWRKSREFYE